MLGQSTQTELVQKGPEVSIALPTASKLDVNTVKMPTANMDELTQYFLKNGAKLTPEVRSLYVRVLIRTEIVDVRCNDEQFSGGTQHYQGLERAPHP